MKHFGPPQVFCPAQIFVLATPLCEGMQLSHISW